MEMWGCGGGGLRCVIGGGAATMRGRSSRFFHLGDKPDDISNEGGGGLIWSLRMGGGEGYSLG